ncbi:MAG TPA: hypothetical protein VFV82_05595 [Candidatus Binatia bacterium]|nr:hypothetical protein [Candidatus Binatia bacterium]
MDRSPDEADKISTETIYQHLQASFNKFPPAQGIYLLGGAWGVKDIIAAENIWAFPWFIRLPPGFGTCKSF